MLAVQRPNLANFTGRSPERGRIIEKRKTDGKAMGFDSWQCSVIRLGDQASGARGSPYASPRGWMLAATPRFFSSPIFRSRLIATVQGSSASSLWLTRLTTLDQDSSLAFLRSLFRVASKSRLLGSDFSAALMYRVACVRSPS